MRSPPSGVRRLLTIAFCLAAVPLRAQEQEPKLLDRLLRPNMNLTNSAQGRRFVADKQAPTKRITAPAFNAGRMTTTRQFNGRRTFFARLFRTSRFRGANDVANLSVRSNAAPETKRFSTKPAVVRHDVADADRTVSTTEFPGTRPFLARGKSQKALSAHDTPLTIEQVRELLNRNK